MVSIGSESEEKNNSIDGEVSYKEVVIIGNGPSGIVLSYMLGGNWPYYNGKGEELNEMLHYRLSSCNKSLVEQDLDYLSQGLEGRSPSRVSCLFDTLTHPNADLGLELPSLLSWKTNSNKRVSHVVLGRGEAGGAWQSMDGTVLTISLGTWMDLPSTNFRDWEKRQEKRCRRECSRATVASLAHYYSSYVRTNGMDKDFKSHSIVTRVRRVSTSEQEGDISSEMWRVEGYSVRNDSSYSPFTYYTKNVVLASGSSDEPNVLGVPGENNPYVLKSLNNLETLILSGNLNQNSDPVLVVGAGLSAADAIIALKFHSIPVIHVFRRSVDDKNLIFRQLPENMYPEYHKVYQMMRDPCGYEGYKGLEQHRLIEITEDHKVKIVGPHCCRVAKVSYILSCIGSHPNLSFLGDLENEIGIYPSRPIECKDNPISINPFTHESIRVPGLYALGPLVGENFVRFLQGGALAITNKLVREKIKGNDQEEIQN